MPCVAGAGHSNWSECGAKARLPQTWTICNEQGEKPMPETNSKLRVLDCQASDNTYLHKDFHGALCYGIKYLDDHYGPEATAEFLRQVGRGYYGPLSARLKQDGLMALEEHWRE